MGAPPRRFPSLSSHPSPPLSLSLPLSPIALPHPCDHQIAADAAVLLPFWMAQPLIQRDIITFSLPAFYNRQFQSAMVADPDAVNLKDHTPYYYELGIKLAQILDSEDLVRLLSHCLTQRLPMIISQSGIHKTSNFTSFLLRLANIERQCRSTKPLAIVLGFRSVSWPRCVDFPSSTLVLL